MEPHKERVSVELEKRMWRHIRMKLSTPWKKKQKQKLKTFYLRKKLVDDNLNLKTIFKAIHSTVTKIIEWDQQIPAFAKLSLNDARENFCNLELIRGASTMATTPYRRKQM